MSLCAIQYFPHLPCFLILFYDVSWQAWPFHCVGLILINPLNAELNAICYLLALLGAHPILHVSRIRVK